MHGDSELVVNQVRGLNAVKNDVLKSYRHRVWDLLEDFDAFNILAIPRHRNQHADRLATVGAQYDIPNSINAVCDQQYIKIIIRPSVLDNNMNWQVFKDDEQILQFLFEEDVFASSNQQRYKEQYGDQVLQLKNNKLPKGLVTLESAFNSDDQVKTGKANLLVQQNQYEHLEVAPGKNLKIGKINAAKEKQSFLHLFQEFNDIFAWEYKDLKGFDPQLAQHTIELESTAKPIRQKQRPVNPRLEPLMQKEVFRLIESKIIFPIKHTSWVANPVPVRKKNGELRLCVDLRDLNRVSLKDRHPLPSMEQILQYVLRAKRFSLLDGYSGYN